MCQLLGLSFNHEIQPTLPLKAFFQNSVFHPNGWGLAFYPASDKQSVLFKEAHPAYDSQLADFVLNYQHLQTRLLIAHIRKATKGTMAQENTHPFSRCYQGREFVFAHNGTLRRAKQLSRLIYQPVGQTDSERAFCYFLTQLSRREIRRTRHSGLNGYLDMDFVEIREIMHEINEKAAGSFNCLISDGEYLFCYMDLAEARNLFYLQHEQQPPKKRGRKNQISKIEHEGRQPEAGYVVATEPCTEGDWQAFTGGQLIVFRDGEMVANLTCTNN
ncbi:MAG: class II glutamine amidotransferase [Clostridia bacterium]|nr:class II glutamine amidotransferase [Clostridia bacterium]